ncbi:MAG TPA: cell envelope integrity protein CreD [Bacteroidales bacterium]|nr:cell envelope integrity protein CreD [Bacteroidales bacterium]
METIEKMTHGFFNSVGFKLGIIVMLTLLLLIPAGMIMGLIREREQRRDETIEAVTSVWGNEQTICGPVLTIPFRQMEKSGEKDYRTKLWHARFLPEELLIEGTVEPEVRYRGIYRVVTYRAKLHVTGRFTGIGLPVPGIPPDARAEAKARIEIGIPDMRGINQDIMLHWGDSLVQVIPGIPGNKIAGSGVHGEVPVSFNSAGSFSFDIDINGSHALNFIPLGKNTTVRLTSSWNAPSFTGAFLPDDREITRTGFTAIWNILQLNRNFPQQWIDDQYEVNESSFGVELITPVDTYQKSERSVKYAVMFIGLTFLIFFFSEIFTRIRIHPVNYLLVGLALCLFYSLLTALAEHLPFALAYLAGSLVIIFLTGSFAHSLYLKWQVTATVSAALLALYAFLYVILQLMDYSLLFGNIGLVIILGLVMYFSRKIDWYSPVKGKKEIVP